MRRNNIVLDKPYSIQYRVRFRSKSLAKLFDSEVHTSHPGVIRRNKPRALRVLTAMQHKGFDAWIEVKRFADGEWEKLLP